MFARTLAGARTAMIIGIAAPGLAIVAGTVSGLVSASGGGRIDLVIQRIMDAFMSLPPLILLLVLVTVLSPSMFTVIMVLIFFVAPSTSRVIRGSTLVIKELQYVEAARTIGASPTRIMFRHIFPGTIDTLIVVATLQVGFVILVVGGDHACHRHFAHGYVPQPVWRLATGPVGPQAPPTGIIPS